MTSYTSSCGSLKLAIAQLNEVGRSESFPFSNLLLVL